MLSLIFSGAIALPALVRQRLMVRLSFLIPLAATVLGCSLDRTYIASDGPALDASLDAGALDQDGGSVPQDSSDDAELDGGHDAEFDAAPIPCTAADEGCTDGIARICSAGFLETRPCSNLGCNADENACAVLMPSNVPPSSFVGTTSAWEISSTETYDTDACTGGTRTEQLITNAQEVCIRHVTTMSIAIGATLHVVGARPLIVLAQRDVTIQGIIDAAASGITPRAGGGIGGSASNRDGIGAFPGIRGATSHEASSGGGGGGFCGAGGRGGTGGNVAGGNGGSSAPPDYSLEPLRGGSGGGFAPGERRGTIDLTASGGAGGGAIQISSRGTIRIDGSIFAGGGGGRGGGATNSAADDLGAGGGGGSGGGVLLEAISISFGPEAQVWTTGGSGGGGASREGTTGHEGGLGRNGRSTGDRAPGGMSGGASLGAAGGRSGGGTMADGEPGSPNTTTDANGGGGGGGAGCIVLRTATGTPPTDFTPFSSSSAVGLRSFVAHHD
jgi:hypothetical protein